LTEFFVTIGSRTPWAARLGEGAGALVTASVSGRRAAISTVAIH